MNGLEIITKGFNWGYLNGKLYLHIECPEIMRTTIQQFITGLTDKTYRVAVKEYKPKRSLDANGYYHAIKDEMANVLRTSKDDLHVELLRRYGQIKTDEDGNKMIISVDSKIDFGSFYKYYDVIGKGMVNGREFTHYKILKGSSEMDSREMSILIDGVVSEAKELGIETLPPAEVERMKQEWGKRNDIHKHT
jgi:hypothetical protein